MQPSQHNMPQYRHLAHLEDSRGIPGPRHGDLLDRAKPEGFGHCGRAVQLCEAKNVQTSGLIRVANCRLWDNNLVSNCLLFMPNKLALRHSFTPLCKQISSVCTFACSFASPELYFVYLLQAMCGSTGRFVGSRVS